MIMFIEINDKNRIISVSDTRYSDEQIEVDSEPFESPFIDDYIYSDGQIIYSPDEEKEKEKEKLSRITELKNNLSETDWYASKILESFLDCSSIVDILKWMKDCKSEFGEMIKNRKLWREELQNIEK